ncbi:MAG: GGDEF domain-containing protein [Bacteroidota bacterium]|nr:GGDEF domain-containing protein [Bacteroidota bacterium]
MISISLSNLILILLVIILGFIIVFTLMYWKIAGYKKLAFSDNLGVFNYRELGKQLALIKKDKSIKAFSFLLLDIDNFKACNDNFGYDKADILLQEFVNYLKAIIRKTDLFFRYKNGDEFVIIIKNISPKEVKEIADRLREAIYNKKFVMGDKELQLSISIGIKNSKNDESIESLRYYAEKALFEAKKNKNSLVVSNE